MKNCFVSVFLFLMASFPVMSSALSQDLDCPTRPLLGDSNSCNKHELKDEQPLRKNSPSPNPRLCNQEEKKCLATIHELVELVYVKRDRRNPQPLNNVMQLAMRSVPAEYFVWDAYNIKLTQEKSSCSYPDETAGLKDMIRTQIFLALAKFELHFEKFDLRALIQKYEFTPQEIMEVANEFKIPDFGRHFPEVQVPVEKVKKVENKTGFFNSIQHYCRSYIPYGAAPYVTALALGTILFWHKIHSSHRLSLPQAGVNPT